MDLSIIIANYNTKSLLAKCIKSIRETSFGVQIIVVDNASTDDSLNQALKLDKKLVVIKNSENVGFAKANNQGIKKASGKFILLLNPDTEVKKGALTALLDFAGKNRDVGVVGPRLLNSDGSIQESVFNFPTIWRAFEEFWLGIKSYSKYAPGNQREVDIVVMAAFLITREALDKVGELDERYFMYFEDLDYCRRVWKSGLKVYYLPQAEVVHHHGVSGKNLADGVNQWRRLVPSSKIYHGILKHYIINFVVWFGSRVIHRWK